MKKKHCCQCEYWTCGFSNECINPKGKYYPLVYCNPNNEACPQFIKQNMGTDA